MIRFLHKTKLKKEAAREEADRQRISEVITESVSKIIELYEFIRSDGNTEQESISVLVGYSSRELPQGEPASLRDYILLRLKEAFPAHIEIAERFLDQNFEILLEKHHREIEKKRDELTRIPDEWRHNKMPYNDLAECHIYMGTIREDGSENVEKIEISKDHDWHRFRMRTRSGDEIYGFSGKIVPGWGYGYRAGYALVRDGKTIDHIVTIKG